MFFSRKTVTPGFEKNKLRTVPQIDAPYIPGKSRNESYLANDIEEAQVICSDIDSLGLIHKPVIDIDFPVYVIPSTTPGHSHLYIDKSVGWGNYIRLLRALEDCGIVESGYVGASEERGFTAVRLPWIKKEKKS